jgi:RimJ/RimL family protein N-acetyltransferase
VTSGRERRPGEPLSLPRPALGDALISLRAPEPLDVAAIAAACRDPLVQRFTRVPRDYDEVDARAFVASAGSRRRSGEALELAIVPGAHERLVGVIGLTVDIHDPARAEVGYWVSPEARGRGIATRALTLLSRWALTEAGFARLDLQASVANGASLRVAERCGYVREGILRRAWPGAGGREDMVLLSMLAGDLNGAGALPRAPD